MPDTLFEFGVSADTFLRRVVLGAARPLLSWVLRAKTLGELYQRTLDDSGEPFETRALRSLAIETVCADDQLALIPREGPIVVVCNHPHGMLDGLLLGAVLRGVRSDVRLLANHMLAGIPEMRETCFFVDPFAGPRAAARSHAGLRAARLWLRNGGALVVFPAGEV